MRRKLIGQGQGGLTVYLPKKWLSEQGLTSGTEVELDVRGDGVLVSAVSGKKKSFSTSMNDLKLDLMTFLKHAYRSGVYQLELLDFSDNYLVELHKALESLIGFTVIEQTSKKVVIAALMTSKEQDYEVILRRLFLLLKETAKNLDVKDADYGEFLIKEMDKNSYLCKRILNEQRLISSTHTQWELLTFLLHIQHAMYYASKQNLNFTKEHIKIIQDAVSDYYNAYYLKKMLYIERLHDLRTKYFELLENCTPEKTVLREILRLLQLSASAILTEYVVARTELTA